MNLFKMKKLALTGLVALVGIVLSGCFLAPPPPIQATLIFSDLVGPVSGQGEVKVSVAQMPGGGLAALVVGNAATGGLRYDPTQFQITDVRGLNGFIVLAWGTFDAGGGLRWVRFVAVDPAEGAVDGDVALIVGQRLGGANFNFQVQKANLQLLAGIILPAAAYNVATGQAPPYYVKGGE